MSWAKWTTLPDNVRFFGLEGSPPAFDRVYNQADGIWIGYPEAEIKDRFAPAMLRDARAVKKVWEAAGKPVAKAAEAYEPEIARSGTAVFTKPVSITFGSGSDALDVEAIAAVNRDVLPQLLIAGGMYARVEGNTDALGDRATNQILSERRAQAIVFYLVTHGVSPQRLVARGNGPAVPRTDILFIRGQKG